MSKTSEPSIYEKAFAKTDKTDAVLVVDGKKLHVNKTLLSCHSDYFNTLFNSEFKEKSMEEIGIKEVDFEHFAAVLSLIHPNPIIPTEYNAEKLLELADRFLLPAAKLNVELFIGTTLMDKHEKLRIADKYDLDVLRDHAVALNSFYDFQGLYKKAENFSDRTKSKLYDRFFSIPKLMTETPEPSIYEKAFAKSNKTDAILVVDGMKLHVNKALLSYHSDYFETLFNADFKEKSMEEIEIKDVDFEEFATLLSMVQKHPIMPTSTQNAEKLLQLADRFLLPAAKHQVELFLITTELDKYDKLRIADKYGLDVLCDHAVWLYDKKTDFLKVYDNTRTFSNCTKSKLYDRYFCLMRSLLIS
ncbi:hypothetical protein CAEBREN_29380 [Caenorhabditis brenneri]|uniref:BTB domain-containing protein n=1 Tax=Caenorhabditis brenneri TaxID=135651 RepID=G0MVX7_CAEBE|nr:hypothetical protein CAEBREN_29380 [Caenorhabditis brenneri]